MHISNTGNAGVGVQMVTAAPATVYQQPMVRVLMPRPVAGDGNMTATAGVQPQPQPRPMMVGVGVPAAVQPAAQAECCPGCVACTLHAPSYKNGLYPIDLQMYTISFFIFAVMNLYPEMTINSIIFVNEEPIYLSFIGLILLLGGCCVLQWKLGAEYKLISGVSFILGGGLYLFGCIIHSTYIPSESGWLSLEVKLYFVK
jgi:hypothetical protein